MSPVPTFKLNNGVIVPAIAFGVGTKWYKSEDEFSKEVVDVVETAYKLGFRHFDGAEVYGTEKELGAALQNVKARRQDVFITTKLKPNSGNDVKAHFDESLKKLGIDYVDLYLLHAPFDVDVVEQWKQAEDIYASGRAKAIGVSNFRIEDLEKVLAVAKVKPAVNQIEYHAYLQNQSPGIVEFSKKHGIQVTGYSPTAPVSRASATDKSPLTPVLTELSQKYKRDPGDILLRWVYQTGVLPVTTSSKPARITNALNIFDFELTTEEVEKISSQGKKVHEW